MRANSAPVLPEAPTRCDRTVHFISRSGEPRPDWVAPGDGVLMSRGEPLGPPRLAGPTCETAFALAEATRGLQMC